MSAGDDLPTIPGAEGAVPRLPAELACLIELTGGTAGRRHRLREGHTLLGRHVTSDVVVRNDGVSRRHAAVHVGQRRVTIVDLDSTNGTFVNGVRVTRRVLRDGDVVQIGSHALFKFRLQDVLEERSHRALVELAMRDGLTELLNRRGFDDCLQRELSYARRHDRVLTLMLFDLDHFKRVNDRYGHAAGDEVLRQIAGRVGELLRREDHFARYGGEEFAIVARDLAGEAARVKAEQVRTVVAARPVAVDAQEICVTVSVGVAAWQPDGDLDAAALLRQADARLYAAKRAGRDRVDTTSPLAA